MPGTSVLLIHALLDYTSSTHLLVILIMQEPKSIHFTTGNKETLIIFLCLEGRIERYILVGCMVVEFCSMGFGDEGLFLAWGKGVKGSGRGPLCGVNDECAFADLLLAGRSPRAQTQEENTPTAEIVFLQCMTTTINCVWVPPSHDHQPFHISPLWRELNHFASITRASASPVPDRPAH
jgi:hypothetical protein